MLDHRLAESQQRDSGACCVRRGRCGRAWACRSVFDSHLALAVRAKPGQVAVLAQLCEPAGELVGQVDGQGHQFGRLIAGTAEHHALVAGADQINLGIGRLTGLGFRDHPRPW